MDSATGSGQRNPNDDGGGASSYFQRTVCLRDWWLVKADKELKGSRLSVAGLTSAEGQPVRVFSSAPITKRYDVFTLETGDGICVVIKGFINKQRTTDHGFPAEVFEHFVFGFPPYWEKFAVDCFGRASTKGAGLGTIPDTDDVFAASNSEKNSVLNARPKSHPSGNNEGYGNQKVDLGDFASGSCEKYREDGCRPTPIGENATSSAGKNIKSDGDMDLKEESFVGLTRTGTKRASRCLGNKQMGGDATASRSRIPVDYNNLTATAARTSNQSDGSPQLRTCGNLVEKPDEKCVEDEHPQEIYGKPGNQIDAMTKGVMEGRNSTEYGGSPVRSAGTYHEACIGVLDRESKLKKQSTPTKTNKKKPVIESLTKLGSQGTKSTPIIVSPESMSYGRSRSGRLLMPALEFWRNELPIYDADRRITGIQQSLPSEPSRGSRSDPRKKRR